MAGVCRMTVSQALNPRAGSVRVSPETRAKIQRLAQKLNYRPNLAARQLAGGSSKIVGYILDAQSTENWISCMATVEQILGEAGYRLQEEAWNLDNDLDNASLVELSQWGNDKPSKNIDDINKMPE